jgi:hypothetical protein
MTVQTKGECRMPTIKVPHYRRVDNGHYVTENYAKKHQATTVKETDKIVVKKKPSPGKKK